MTDGPHSATREYWGHPDHDRRRVFSRREKDYSVCPFHATKCSADEKIAEAIVSKVQELKTDHDAEVKAVWEGISDMRNQIVGRFAFRTVISIIVGINITSSVIMIMVLNKMWRDIEALETIVRQILTKIQ